MGGRPRDPDLEKRLLSAAWSLLTSEGYDTLTLSQAAARAKAHRTDVYRRWPTKAQLVTAALAEFLPPISDTDTGTLYDDLRAALDDLAAAWSSAWADGMAGLLADLRRDPDAYVAFRTMSSRRSQPLLNAVSRAVQRGEIREVTDLALLGGLLEGPLMHRRLFRGGPFTPDDLDAVAQSAYRLLTGTLVLR